MIENFAKKMQLHIGSSNIRNTAGETPRCSHTAPFRPCGFWTSTFIPENPFGSEWGKYASYSFPEDFQNGRAEAMLMKIRPDALIFEIHSLLDLKRLIELFPSRKRWCDGEPAIDVDWDWLKETYDAVHVGSRVAKQQHRHRLNINGEELIIELNLECWTVESTCWFNLDAFAETMPHVVQLPDRWPVSILFKNNPNFCFPAEAGGLNGLSRPVRPLENGPIDEGGMKR